MLIDCSYCGERLSTNPFCSEKCRKELERLAELYGSTTTRRSQKSQEERKELDKNKPCSICNSTFYDKRNTKKYCGTVCSRVALWRRKPYLKHKYLAKL